LDACFEKGCSDPRYRTGYANAARGPKDVVLVLDDSGSMNTNNRIGKMKEAAKWVISTLGPNDYVSIVKFTNSAESTTENLIPATIENRAELKNYIDTNFNANGGTNMV
jgi:Mg-chelatase subunit ChlD